jgi:hypothetical protein
MDKQVGVHTYYGELLSHKGNELLIYAKRCKNNEKLCQEKEIRHRRSPII